MKIHHIALWVNDLEIMKNFYASWFDGQASEKYVNQVTQFSSYFITFVTGTAIELMHKNGTLLPAQENSFGYAHLAFEVDSRKQVDLFAEKFASNGNVLLSAPRLTGDGYYECVIRDPENNKIEVVFK
jgi:lactoylglutathione lyase